MNIFTAKRISRGVYALYMIPCALLSFFLNICVKTYIAQLNSGYGERLEALFIAILGVWIFVLIIEIVTIVKRLHDIGKSGCYAFLLIIPLINLILMIALFFWPPKKDLN